MRPAAAVAGKYSDPRPRRPSQERTRCPRGGTALGPTCGVPEVGQHWARPPATPRWDSTGPDLRRAEWAEFTLNHSLFDRPIQALVTYLTVICGCFEP